MPPTVPTIPLTPAQRALAASHPKLPNFVLNKHFRKHRDNYHVWQDLRSAAHVGLCLAAQRYQPHRGEFNTFAIPTIWGTINKALRTLVRQLDFGTTSPDFCFGPSIHDTRHPEQSAPLLRSETVALVRRAVDALPRPDRDAIRLRYGLSGAPLEIAAVGERLNISERVARYRIDRAAAKLRTLLHEAN